MRYSTTYQTRITYEYYDSDSGTNHTAVADAPIVRDGASQVRQYAGRGISFVHSWNKYFFEGKEDISFLIELTPDQILQQSLDL